MTDTAKNLELWNKVARVPAEHLKAFTRGGGFKGTAIKPMWSIKTMTEHYGPCGVGWGVGEPKFDVVSAEGEILVFCTASVWHHNKANIVYGVGGDKVRAQFSNGPKNDDEAFKKAYTDALTNALKLLGVGADIHMGLWDGNKYVTEPQNGEEPEAIERKPHDRSPLVRKEYERIDKGLNDIFQTGSLEDLRAFWVAEKLVIEHLPADWRSMITAKKDEIKEQLGAKAA